MTTPMGTARHFLQHEQAFRLGFLPTEQPHPRTRRLSAHAQRHPQAACALLLSVDAALVTPLRRAMRDPSFLAFQRLLEQTVCNGGRIILSGCGATGRLCLLLEAAWRKACRPRPSLQAYAGAVRGIMTGGDYAFIRSVESFEDSAAFGARQIEELGITAQDCVVGISEGGETSSVLGSVRAGRKGGARAALLCNNPHEILRTHLERSRQILDDPEILCLELDTGPMALAGSTRMQAATSELLYVGTALEQALSVLMGNTGHAASGCPRLVDAYLASFEALVQELTSTENIAVLGQWTALEAACYRAGACVTYFAREAMIDILTDTTERTPTFALPPFAPYTRADAARPWASVKHPALDTEAAWRAMLGRPPVCLHWTARDYAAMRAADRLIDHPPCIDEAALMLFRVGNEADPTRYLHPDDIAFHVCTESDRRVDGAGATATINDLRGFGNAYTIILRNQAGAHSRSDGEALTLTCRLPESPLQLWEHLALKLVFNTVSTAAMARVGRIMGNWMIHVQPTNKKLIDRSCRILQAILGIPYETACRLLFEELAARDAPLAERPSPVHAILHRSQPI